MSHDAQADTFRLHEHHGILIGETPAIRRADFRAALIREEAKETVDAIRDFDLLGAIDGMCDLICVVYGTAIEFGIDLGPFWDEVHKTNMAKVNSLGAKLVKPLGWEPPDLRRVMRDVYGIDVKPRASWVTEQAALCCECGTIAPAHTFLQMRADEDTGEMVPIKPSQSDPSVIRCPGCGHDHRDDDSGAGMYEGSFADMERERSRLLADPEMDWGPWWGESWERVVA
jgi:Phosphoribosyl-ATP pyrophosphohydrolase